MIPSQNKIKILVKGATSVLLGVKGLKLRAVNQTQKIFGDNITVHMSGARRDHISKYKRNKALLFKQWQIAH